MVKDKREQANRGRKKVAKQTPTKLTKLYKNEILMSFSTNINDPTRNERRTPKNYSEWDDRRWMSMSIVKSHNWRNRNSFYCSHFSFGSTSSSRPFTIVKCFSCYQQLLGWRYCWYMLKSRIKYARDDDDTICLSSLILWILWSLWCISIFNCL